MLLRVLSLTTDILRLLASTTLVVLEPLVRLLLCSLSILGCSMTAFFTLTESAPPSVITGMLLVSIGSLLLLRGYYAVIRWLH